MLDIEVKWYMVRMYMQCLCCVTLLHTSFYCRMKNLKVQQMVYGLIKDILNQNLVEENLYHCYS